MRSKKSEENESCWYTSEEYQLIQTLRWSFRCSTAVHFKDDCEVHLSWFSEICSCQVLSWSSVRMLSDSTNLLFEITLWWWTNDRFDNITHYDQDIWSETQFAKKSQVQQRDDAILLKAHVFTVEWVCWLKYEILQKVDAAYHLTEISICQQVNHSKEHKEHSCDDLSENINAQMSDSCE